LHHHVLLPHQALSQLSQDAPFMATLQSWLAELLPERSDANAHVLLKILELLSRLPDSSWALLGSSGLLESIKTASEHRNREVAQQAAAIRKVRRTSLLKLKQLHTNVAAATVIDSV
jgi:hypothetical protein